MNLADFDHQGALKTQKVYISRTARPIFTKLIGYLQEPLLSPNLEVGHDRSMWAGLTAR